MQEVEHLHVRMTGDAAQYMGMLAAAESATARTAAALTAAGTRLTTALTVPLALVGGVALKAFADFDSAMTQSTSIMNRTFGTLDGLSDETADRMRRHALELSGRSLQSPYELARAYYYLASAGLTAEQAMSALGPMARFATAGQFDMARATDLATDAQMAAGLVADDAAVNERNLIRVTDAFIAANQLANANAEQFSESLTNELGPALRLVNRPLEEGVALMAVYAGQGVKGAAAGSMAARMLRLMSAAAVENADAWRRYGLSLFDAAGEMRPLADVVENLEQVLGGMSYQQKVSTLLALGFQARVQNAILPVIGLSWQIRRMEGAVRGMAGATQVAAERQLRSFSAQLRILWNNLKIVSIGVGRLLAPAVGWVGARVRDLADWWNGASEATRKFWVAAGAVLALLGPLALALGGVLRLLVLWRPGVLLLLSPVTGLIGVLYHLEHALIGVSLAALNPLKAFPALVGGIWALGGAALWLLNPLNWLRLAWLALYYTMLSPASFIFWTLLKIGGLVALLVHTTGGWAQAWEAVKRQFAGVWAATRPVRDALWDLLVAVGGALWGALVAAGEEMVHVLHAIGEVAGVSAESFGDAGRAVIDGLVTALLYAEFTVRRFPLVWEVAVNWMAWKLVQWTDSVVFFFSTTLPEVAGWAWRNVGALVADSIQYIQVRWTNLVRNLRTLWTNLMQALRGRRGLGELTEGMVDLGEGFHGTVVERLRLTSREASALEGQLRGVYEASARGLGRSFAEFRDERLAEWAARQAKDLDFFAAAARGKAGAAAGPPAVPGLPAEAAAGARAMQDHVQPVQQVLAGSAAAVSRVQSYRDRIAPTRAQVQQDARERMAAEQLQEQRRGNEILQEIAHAVTRPGGGLAPADLE